MPTSYYMVTYDRLLERAISNLSLSELDKVSAYNVRKDINKNISPKIKSINEWELNWYDHRYQKYQYYEYGAIAHLSNNTELLEESSHIGLFHYDIIFKKNSIDDIEKMFIKNPNQIFYFSYVTDNRYMYFSRDQLNKISEFLEKKLEISIDTDFIWNNGWIAEALSITPKEIFVKFGKFLSENIEEINSILKYNKWDIMKLANHRPCGFTERLWGIYLSSLNIPFTKLNNIIHDWDYYQHEHGNQIKNLKL